MYRWASRKFGSGLRSLYMLLPSLKLASLVAVALYLIVYPPELDLSSLRSPEQLPLVTTTRANISSPSTLTTVTPSTLNPSLTYRPNYEDPTYNYNLDPHNDHWRSVKMGKCDVHMYSAFFDDRRSGGAVVKMNVALHTTYRTKCAKDHRCVLQDSKGRMTVVASVVVQFKEHFALPYGSHYLNCQLGELHLGRDWSKVSVIKYYKGCEEDYALKKLKMPENALDINRFIKLGKEQNEQKERTMAACIKPFHYSWNRALWLIEFIEFHKLLGVNHFVFYNDTLGPAVTKVVERYQRTGEVTVLRWNLPLKTQRQIRTEGMFTALNECNLRLINRFEFVLMIDVDEYILPYNDTNLFDMIDHLKIKSNIGALVFRNAFHYLYWENDTRTTEKHARNLFESFSITKNGSVRPYLLTQTKTKRLVTPHKHGTRSKYITRPEAADMVGNHLVWTFLPGFVPKNVDPNVAVSHHYRICEFGGFDCLKQASKIDPVAHNWAKDVFTKVKYACDRTFGPTGCPKAPPLGSPW